MPKMAMQEKIEKKQSDQEEKEKKRRNGIKRLLVDEDITIGSA